MDYSTLYTGSATTGYNIIEISPPVFFQRGAILYIYPETGALGINTASSASYQDFIWDTNLFLAPNHNLFVRVITQSTSNGSAIRTNSFAHNYTSPGSYSLDATFECNGISYQDSALIQGEKFIQKSPVVFPGPFNCGSTFFKVTSSTSSAQTPSIVTVTGGKVLKQRFLCVFLFD